jgi:hypothetical protein
VIRVILQQATILASAPNIVVGKFKQLGQMQLLTVRDNCNAILYSETVYVFSYRLLTVCRDNL